MSVLQSKTRDRRPTQRTTATRTTGAQGRIFIIYLYIFYNNIHRTHHIYIGIRIYTAIEIRTSYKKNATDARLNPIIIYVLYIFLTSGQGVGGKWLAFVYQCTRC